MTPTAFEILLVAFCVAVATGGPLIIYFRHRLGKLVEVNDALKVECAERAVRGGAALDVVRRVEWIEISVPTDGEPHRVGLCPWCLGEKPTHKPGCGLDELLEVQGRGAQ